jgi:cullin 3
MNTCPQTPYNIALYSDNEFKKGLKQLSDIQIDQRLSAIVRLFCCLHGRDTFIMSYTNFLAHRLLNKSSVSNEAEELMIQKLQIECGHNTVNKIKTMF